MTAKTEILSRPQKPLVETISATSQRPEICSDFAATDEKAIFEKELLPERAVFKVG
jgi:hypothetical protein